MDSDILAAAKTYAEYHHAPILYMATTMAAPPIPVPECPENPEPLFACPRYQLVVTADICARCKAEPDFKQSLYARYVRDRAARGLPCKHQGKAVETREVVCCGGHKTASVNLYDCSKLGRRVAEPDCWVCDLYQAKEA